MVLFFALSLGLLHFVHLNSCRSYIETWGGLLPVQVSVMCSAILAVIHSSSVLDSSFSFGQTSLRQKSCSAQIVMTAMVCCWAHLMTPADPRKTSPVLGVSTGPPYCACKCRAAVLLAACRLSSAHCQTSVKGI